MDEELKCKICGKLASEDSHFYPNKQLCNKHYIQMYRYGEIVDDKPHRKLVFKHKCDICNDTMSKHYRIWHSDDEYNGQELCTKHYAQLYTNNKITDISPAIHIKLEDRTCEICGSKNHVIYHNGKCYCLRHYSQIKNLGGLKEITVFDRNRYEIKEDGVHIYIRNQKNEDIAETIIDEEDLDRVIQYKWSIGTWGYANAMIDGKNIMLQRFILQEYDKNKIPDHINRNPLDNRKSNLRVVNKSMNAINTDIRSNNSSGVTGVSWSKQANAWRSYINYNGERIELGCFSDINNAIIARLNAENKYYAGRQPQANIFEKYGVLLYE